MKHLVIEQDITELHHRDVPGKTLKRSSVTLCRVDKAYRHGAPLIEATFCHKCGFLSVLFSHVQLPVAV